MSSVLKLLNRASLLTLSLLKKRKCAPPIYGATPVVRRTVEVRTLFTNVGGKIFGNRRFCTSVVSYKRKKDDYPPKSIEDDKQEEFLDSEVDLQDKEVEELFQQRIPVVPEGGQRIFIVHPDVKWGVKKQHLTTGELQMAEAVALVNSLPDWMIVDTIIMPTKTPDTKYVFGKGNLQAITEKISALPQLTAVFMNVERLSPLAEKELEDLWGVKVFDRYTVVLHIFRYNARTKEAKLQITLAEIPLLKSRLKNELANKDQQGGGSRYIMGSGETFTEVQHRLLKEKEMKIKSALEKLRQKRTLLRAQRTRREFPVISVVGYTNCGKTTLIKALTGDTKLQPRDQLFATLDITAHAGVLPSHMTVIYVDTVGFLSQLPHGLIQSFSATLEDVIHSDLIVHVRDISHPESLNQKVNVLNVLKNLNLPSHLLDSLVEVHNKIDLQEGYCTTDPNILGISALHGYGLEELKQRIENAVLKSTGRQIMTLRVKLSGLQLSWLYKEATVQKVDVMAEDDTANVSVIISNSAYGKYKKMFP
ncbi:putative GTP-binding protein 6 [Protopterus annectens]|uniref:putative GTP-binding protein 6 n=1 Tax=Protopterus annectens TaxID=7888 RepID=UPI001CFA8EDA|nr:putative GTP-binding protein 6 [Protopterus annectens]